MEEKEKKWILNSFLGLSLSVFALSRRSVRLHDTLFNHCALHRASPWYTAFSYSVNHANWRHLGLNMAMLWVVGSQFVASDKVSSKQMGWLMMGSCLGTAAMRSPIPMIGASGIVFGLLGALSVIDPLKTWLLLFPIPGVPMTNAQLVQVSILGHLALLMNPRRTKTALWGHLGGLFAGMGIASYMWGLPRVNAYRESWERTASSAVLVLHWLALSTQLVLGYAIFSEEERGEKLAKQRFIKRTWRDETLS